MSVSLESLGIDKMSIDERIELAQAIWNSIPTLNGTLPISEEISRELDKRIAEDDASPDDVVSWEEVKAEALKQIKP